MNKVIFRLCIVLVGFGVSLLILLHKNKKQEKHIQWWKNYYDKKETPDTSAEDIYIPETSTEDIWTTVPQTALLRKEVLEKILGQLNLFNAYFTFENNQVIATITKNKNVLVFKIVKNSWILFVDYKQIIDKETTSKLLDFKTVIDNSEENFDSAVKHLKFWLEEEHIFG